MSLQTQIQRNDYQKTFTALILAMVLPNAIGSLSFL